MKVRTIKAVISVVVALVWVSGAGMLSAAETGSEETTEPKAGGVIGIEERIEHLEQALGRTVESDKWYDRLQISGLIEVEAAYQKVDIDDPAEEDTKQSDLALATVELAVDARIVDHVDGHVLFKYEDDDLFVDEGFITLSGTEDFPAYLIAGRQYIPFGYFESHFVTDPNTLVLGETNAGSVVAGYRIGDELIDISVGAFNGRIDKAGDDDIIDSFVAAIVVQPLSFLTVGASYTSNLAASDALSEFVVDADGDGEADSLDDQVGGWSAFVMVELMERFKLIGEYAAALDSFKAGELYDTGDTKERDLSTWNFEFGAVIIDSLVLAVRYGGSDDGGAEFLPETQYGAVVNWGFFENTNLALEYMHNEYEDDVQEADTATAQLAIAF
jgi:hypothetical protein